eukprot:361961-Chlamydomonas_euryale.AAC.5
MCPKVTHAEPVKMLAYGPAAGPGTQFRVQGAIRAKACTNELYEEVVVHSRPTSQQLCTAAPAGRISGGTNAPTQHLVHAPELDVVCANAPIDSDGVGTCVADNGTDALKRVDHVRLAASGEVAKHRHSFQLWPALEVMTTRTPCLWSWRA